MVDLSLAFHGTDFLVGLLLVIEACFSFFPLFHVILLALYQLTFGLMVMIFVFYAPVSLAYQINFYWDLLGRGISFLFLGCLALSSRDVSIATGAIILIVSLIYILIWVIDSFLEYGIQPPKPLMQRDEENFAKPLNADDDAKKSSLSPR